MGRADVRGRLAVQCRRGLEYCFLLYHLLDADRYKGRRRHLSYVSMTVKIQAELSFRMHLVVLTLEAFVACSHFTHLWGAQLQRQPLTRAERARIRRACFSSSSSLP